jgi:ribosomal-protein-serine acetyltransferase
MRLTQQGKMVYCAPENSMDKAQLSGNGILLRAHNIGDIENRLSAVKESFADVNPWMPWGNVNYSTEYCKNWIELCEKNWNQDTDYQFAIIDAQDGVYLGGCGLSDINLTDKVAHMGYWVRSRSVKNGIATTAALLLADFGFHRVKLNRIEILVAVENQASQRVMEKTGARREGIMRNRLLLHDVVHDAVMFSLIPTDIKAYPVKN